MARTQTFLNGEVGLSIRNKLNSLAEWSASYSYNINDITHYSGFIYSSKINSNVGNIPNITSSQWKDLTISSSWASSSISASYISSLNIFDPTIYGLTASWSNNSIQSLFATQSLFSTQSISASYVATASFAFYATTASFALNGGGSGTSLSTGSTYPITSSWAVDVVNGSNATYTSSLYGTSSWAIDVVNGSNATYTSSLYGTSSWAINVVNGSTATYTSSLYGTASWSNNTVTASYMTGSNFKIVGNELQILGQLGTWFVIKVYEDPVGTGSIELTAV